MSKLEKGYLALIDTLFAVVGVFCLQAGFSAYRNSNSGFIMILVGALFFFVLFYTRGKK